MLKLLRFIQYGFFFLLLLFTPIARAASPRWAFCIAVWLCLVAVSAMVLKRFYGNESILTRTPLERPVALLLAIAGASYFSSIYRFETLWALLRLMLYIGAFYLSLDAAQIRPFPRRLPLTIVAIGAIIALVGFAKYFAGDQSSMNSTFVNRDHMAGYLEMIFALGLGLLLLKPVGSPVVWHACLALILVAICLSTSRGGWIGSFVAVDFILILFLKKRQSSPMKVWLTAASFACVAGLTFVASSPMIDRLQAALPADASLISRMQVSKACIPFVLKHPLRGAGLGAFPWAFHSVRPLGLDDNYQETHNDYMQIAVEAGLPVLIPISWGLFVLFRTGTRSFMRTRSRFRAGVLVGSMGGVAAILTHSLVDFNIQITSNGVLFSCLLGLIMGAARPSASSSGAEAPARARSLSALNPKALVAALVFVVVVAPATGALFRLSSADACATFGKRDLEAKKYSAAKDSLETAISYTASNAEYYRLLGDVLYAMAEEANPPTSPIDLYWQAEDAYQKAVGLNPLDGDAWLGVGMAHWQVSSFEGHEEEEKNIEPYLLRALSTDPNNGRFLYTLAAYHLTMGEAEKGVHYLRLLAHAQPGYYGFLKKTPAWTKEIEAQFSEALEEAVPSVYVHKQALGVLASLAESDKDWLAAARYTEALLADAATPDSEAALLYKIASYRLKLGDVASAKEQLLQALKLDEKGRPSRLRNLLRPLMDANALGLYIDLCEETASYDWKIKKDLNILLGRAHLANGDDDRAAYYFRRCLEGSESPEAHRGLAEIALREKNLDVAEIEAQRATALDPKNDDYRKFFLRILETKKKL